MAKATIRLDQLRDHREHVLERVHAVSLRQAGLAPGMGPSAEDELRASAEEAAKEKLHAELDNVLHGLSDEERALAMLTVRSAARLLGLNYDEARLLRKRTIQRVRSLLSSHLQQVRELR